MKFLIVLMVLSFHVSAQDRPVSDLLLSLSDEELVKAAMSGKTGKCSISDARNCSQCFCDFYAKTTKSGLEGQGLPHGYGSGCVVAPEYPKAVDICWGAPNFYQQYNKSKTPICGSSFTRNAANMIRIGIEKKLCDLAEATPIKDDVAVCRKDLKNKDEEIKAANEEIEKHKTQLKEEKKKSENCKKQFEDEKKRSETLKRELDSIKKQLDEEKKKKKN